MDKKGNMGGKLIITVAIAIMIYMAGSLFITPISNLVDTTATSMSCATPASVSAGTLIVCLILDLVNPTYILIFIGLALGLIISNFAI